MTINEIRNILYISAKMLGDINAINKNKLGKRIITRGIGRLTGRFLRSIINFLFKKPLKN
ncbi:MAG: hypothetical protein ACK4R9_11850 [Ignavibacterium sp.]